MSLQNKRIIVKRDIPILIPFAQIEDRNALVRRLPLFFIVIHLCISLHLGTYLYRQQSTNLLIIV